MRRAVVIVAGGNGKRMGSEIPKQFIPIDGKPIIFRTIEKFIEFDDEMEIILVLPEDQIDYYTDLCFRYAFQHYLSIAVGGSERFYSVKNGLKMVDKGSLIAIHDGVRPFVTKETINKCFLSAAEHGSGVPVISPHESVRQINNDGNTILDRNTIRLIQTPQVFRSEIIMKAYDQDFSPTFTDDASVVEKAGHKIHLVEGNIENIKITRPFDLTIARAITQQD